jgi:glyoxylase-like metal-dependent hydrolase (beta-lactamase superfamily II)
MKEIFPGIYLIEEVRKFLKFLESTNIYIIAGVDGLIYDGGYGNKGLVKRVIKEVRKVITLYDSKNEKINLTRILPSHSHSDHISGLSALRRYLGVKILLTKDMANIIKDKKSFSNAYRADSYRDYYNINKGLKKKLITFLQGKFSYFFWNIVAGISYIKDPDELINTNSNILINNEVWKVFPSPGHSFDHISLYNEEKGVLFTGDNLFKSISGWLGPPESNLDDYMNTLENYSKLRNLKLILPAHGEPIENPKERINEIILHRKKRIKQVFDLIAESKKNGLTLKEIINKIYTNGNKMIKQIARGWVCLTLKKLEEENHIFRQESKNEIRFFCREKI